MRLTKDVKHIFRELEVLENIEQYDELKKWAVAYLAAAEDAGEDLVVFDRDDDLTYLPAAGTIRLVCDLFPFCGSAELLTWQCYGRPRGRGRWWICDFNHSPFRWMNASLIIRNPWNFIFSHLLVAQNEHMVEFEMHTPKRGRINKAKRNWLAGAVLDGVLEDYDETEFQMLCKKVPHSRSLVIGIYQWDSLTDCLPDNPSQHPKKDARGIYWQ